MKGLFIFLGCVAVAQSHYVFACMALNGQWTPFSKYVRNRTSSYEDLYDNPTTPDSTYYGTHREYNYPAFPLDRPESIRCGRGNMQYAAATETLDVPAGSNITFFTNNGTPKNWQCTPESREVYFAYHGGPIQAYLSPVPQNNDIAKYDGSGYWIKIHTRGLDLEALKAGRSMWTKMVAANYTFQIPPKTPPGVYLMRFEHTYPRALPYHGQFYPSCAHINVKGPGGGTLPKGIKIPEDVPWNHPGLNVSAEMESGKKVDETYVYPGGDLWDGK